MDNYGRSSLNAFVAHNLDRMHTARRDERWIADQLRAPATGFIVMWQSQNLMAEGETPRPVLLSPQDLEDLIPQAESIALLGQSGGRTYFVLDLPDDAPAISERFAPLGRFQDLRNVAPLLDREAGTLLAYAKALTYWHRQHRFCGRCGSPTTNAEAGHLRVCTNPRCGQQHFPRTDPAIIVLVTYGERCLLGRQAIWSPGRYSTLAGFVEPGESLEDAVVREVLEETGIRVEEVVYHSSQPWPFPTSLMLGFNARAATQEIHLADGELEDARWWSRPELAEALRNGAVGLSASGFISRHLIEDWFDAGDCGRLNEILEPDKAGTK